MNDCLCWMKNAHFKLIYMYFLEALTLFFTTFQAHVENMNHFINLILVYMGSPERLINSDLRAKLAEALETFLPQRDNGTTTPLLR